MFEVVCLLPTGEFDHLQGGFKTEREARDYINANKDRDAGCDFSIWPESLPIS